MDVGILGFTLNYFIVKIYGVTQELWSVAQRSQSSRNNHNLIVSMTVCVCAFTYTYL